MYYFYKMSKEGDIYIYILIIGVELVNFLEPVLLQLFFPFSPPNFFIFIFLNISLNEFCNNGKCDDA